MALKIDRELVLASSSPSRKMLLEQAGLTFEVAVSGVDETVPPDYTPAQTVETLALSLIHISLPGPSEAPQTTGSSPHGKPDPAFSQPWSPGAGNR